MTRILLALISTLALALTASACGEKEEALGPEGSSKLTLMLDYFPNADHAGIYSAQAGGMFELFLGSVRKYGIMVLEFALLI